jgi:hypothetical protein
MPKSAPKQAGPPGRPPTEREERFAAEAADLGLPPHMGSVLDTIEDAVPQMTYRLLVDALRGKPVAKSRLKPPAK